MDAAARPRTTGHVAPALDIGVQCLVGLVEVSLDGRLDGSTADEAQRALERLLLDGATTIDVDCTELVEVDGFGLALLLDADRELRRLGGALVVRHPQPCVLDRLLGAGFEHLLLVP